MSTNSPQQRPVQHNPYSMTPNHTSADPRAHPNHSPPPPLDHSTTPRTLPASPSQTPSDNNQGQPQQRFSGNANCNTGGYQQNTPQLGFVAGGYNSMYVATPQHGPQAARMSPGPPLGPPAHQSHRGGGFGPNSNDTQGGNNFHGSEVPPYALPPALPEQMRYGGGGGGGGGHFDSYGQGAQNFTPYGGGGGGGGGGHFGGGGSAGSFQTHTLGNSPGGNSGGGGSLFGNNNAGRQFHDYPAPTHLPGQAPTGFSRNPPRSFTAYGPGPGATGLRPTSQQQGGQGGSQDGTGVSGGAGVGGGSYGNPRSQNGRSTTGGNNNRCAHNFLVNKLRYLALPPEMFIMLPPHRQQLSPMTGDLDRPIQMYSGRGREMQAVCPTADLFVAQLPFNMDLSALQFIFDSVAGTSCDIMHAAPHYKRGRSYDGCAFVKVSQSVAAILVETFHKAALFDQEGVWIADTPEQRDTLAQYCAFMQQKSPQERRQILQKPIPFSAMTVEFANRSYSF
jgi:hypothetical protein